MNKSNITTRISKYIGCQYVIELTRPNAISKGQLFELIGYWQSYLHFIKYANELRQDIFIGIRPILEKISHFFLDIYQQKFHFKPQFSFDDHQIFKRQLIHLNQTVWIGIHIRRTDFVDVQYSSSDQYLFTAINYFTELYSNAYFIVASDDKSYCRNLFRNRSNIFMTPDSFSISEDLIILSLCEHSIITGGTFGWWAAFLANGQVVHDTIYPSGCEKREHYYPPWFLINGYVRATKNSQYIL
jgi:galactoside 2-L-fucosyltransferase 1/2